MAKKAPIKRKPVKAVPQAEIILPDGTPLSMVLQQTNAALRLAAGQQYITSIEGLTIKQIHDQPQFAHLSMRTMENWCFQDKWSERRREFVVLYSKHVENEIGSELVQSRVKELRMMEQVCSAIEKAGMTKDADGNIVLTLQPKSLEGWARVRLEYSEYLDKMRSSLGEYIIPAVSPRPEPQEEQRPTTLHPNLRIRPTENEATAMGVLLMRMRREEVEKLLRERGEAEEPTPRKKRPPPLDEGDEDGEDGEA
jgi:hypothetical protein